MKHPLLSVTVADIGPGQSPVTEADPDAGTVNVPPGGVLKLTVYPPVLPPLGIIINDPEQTLLHKIFEVTDPVETGVGAVTVLVTIPLQPFLSRIVKVYTFAHKLPSVNPPAVFIGPDTAGSTVIVYGPNPPDAPKVIVPLHEALHEGARFENVSKPNVGGLKLKLVVFAPFIVIGIGKIEASIIAILYCDPEQSQAPVIVPVAGILFPLRLLAVFWQFAAGLALLTNML
jgi:hypothetical protein